MCYPSFLQGRQRQILIIFFRDASLSNDTEKFQVFKFKEILNNLACEFLKIFYRGKHGSGDMKLKMNTVV